ncbi:MAG: hypothetical protein ACJAX2_002479 [Celeribacter sp.]|jgi:hypothetical protein
MERGTLVFHACLAQIYILKLSLAVFAVFTQKLVCGFYIKAV